MRKYPRLNHNLVILIIRVQDSSMDVREGLQRILTSCSFVTKDCLQMCVVNLLDSLKKYPQVKSKFSRRIVHNLIGVGLYLEFHFQDKKSIWNCFHKMGCLHASLTLPLVPELLAIHPFFDTPEPNVDDPACILECMRNLRSPVSWCSSTYVFF